ncbi:MAG: hypothetical protein CSA45_01485, partial [Gammaproteobacteria bacterium]
FAIIANHFYPLNEALWPYQKYMKISKHLKPSYTAETGSSLSSFESKRADSTIKRENAPFHYWVYFVAFF